MMGSSLKAVFVSLLLTSTAAVHVMSSHPTGTYKGSKTVLDEKVKATIVLLNSTHLDLDISGAVSISCADEPRVARRPRSPPLLRAVACL